MEDDLNEDDPNEDNLNEEDLNGGESQFRRTQWKMTTYQENDSGRRPYTTITLGCLASQFCTDLGPAQPQLFLCYFYYKLTHILTQCVLFD